MPYVLGAPRSEWLLLPKRAADLSEGTQWGKGGTGKAEDAKLQDAGISPKQCLKKWTAENGRLPIELRENRVRGQLREPSPSKDSSEVTWPFEGATGGGNEN